MNGEVLPATSPFHRHLSTMEQDAQTAFEAERRIKVTLGRMRSDWVELAGQVYEFHQARQWEALGYETFDLWCASPEIELGFRHVYTLIEVWRELVVKRGVTPERLSGAAVSKVQSVLPAVKLGRVEVGQALDDAEHLGRDDLRERYAKNKPDTSTRLEATEEPSFFVCEACGSRVRQKDA